MHIGLLIYIYIYPYFIPNKTIFCGTMLSNMSSSRCVIELHK